MKTYGWVVSAILLATLAMVGCGKPSGADAPQKQSSIDTSQIQSSFKGAEAPVQSSVDKAVSAVKSADYTGALAELKTLAGDVKLTPEQKAAVSDLIAQVQKALTDAAGKAAGDAGKTVDDVKKALPK